MLNFARSGESCSSPNLVEFSGSKLDSHHNVLGVRKAANEHAPVAVQALLTLVQFSALQVIPVPIAHYAVV